jgi:hypothetical protein
MNLGLDVSHDCWSGSYSRFSAWRDELARLAGYRFRSPTEADKKQFLFRDYVDLNWEDIPMARLQGDWEDEVPDDALLYLIVHSDCDGVIYPEHAGPLADRLEQLLPELEDTPHEEWPRRTRQFIAGLRYAVDQGEVVEFV